MTLCGKEATGMVARVVRRMIWLLSGTPLSVTRHCACLYNRGERRLRCIRFEDIEAAS